MLKFSKILSEIMRENNLKQEEVAEKVGLSQSAISKYLNKQSPSFDIAIHILATFNYDISEFYSTSLKDGDNDYSNSNESDEELLIRYKHYKKIIEERFGPEYL